MTDKIEYSPAQQKSQNSVSIIWIVPLLALCIGGWMIFQQWQDKGVIVEVSFESAEGLEVGKTKIKSRNVDIGTLIDVRFNDDRKRIIASIEIEKSMADFLRTDSQFWIVKPRIGTNGISGIGTIFSGAYIEVYPGTFKSTSDTFVGLESPPITELGASGLHLTLYSQSGSSLSVGDPIIFRGFTVGKILTYAFDARERQAKYDIFIAAPYDSLVTTNTHFWNAGGVSLESSAKGFKLNIATIEAFISGGVEFDVPDDLALGEAAKPYKNYPLYASRDDVIENRAYQSFEYVVLVPDSVRGLVKGAPVEYRGIRVGSVVSPYLTPQQTHALNISKVTDVLEIPVLIKIEPERLLGQSTTVEIANFNQDFIKNIKTGLTANIESANLLTGSLLINLDFNGDKRSTLEKLGPYIKIPSTREGLAKIQDSIEQFLDSVNKLPYDQIANKSTILLSSADKTLKSLRSSIYSLNRLLKDKETQQLSRNLNLSMLELQTTLKGLQPDSGAYQKIEKTMSKLQKTLNDLQPMLKRINNNPSTLIFSSPRGADLEPKKK